MSHTFLPIIVSHVGIIIMHINDDIKQPIDNFDLIVKKKCLHYKGFIILWGYKYQIYTFGSLFEAVVVITI